jgi:hypothetical protein
VQKLSGFVGTSRSNQKIQSTDSNLSTENNSIQNTDRNDKQVKKAYPNLVIYKKMHLKTKSIKIGGIFGNIKLNSKFIFEINY